MNEYADLFGPGAGVEPRDEPSSPVVDYEDIGGADREGHALMESAQHEGGEMGTELPDAPWANEQVSPSLGVENVAQGTTVSIGKKLAKGRSKDGKKLKKTKSKDVQGKANKLSASGSGDREKAMALLGLAPALKSSKKKKTKKL